MHSFLWTCLCSIDGGGDDDDDSVVRNQDYPDPVRVVNERLMPFGWWGFFVAPLGATDYTEPRQLFS